jgi:hypothetical protein
MIPESLKEFVILEHEINDGTQVILKFSNGFGASVIRGPHTYGGAEDLYEIAVLDNTGEISYVTGITDDVIGWLTSSDVKDVLESVQALGSKID